MKKNYFFTLAFFLFQIISAQNIVPSPKSISIDSGSTTINSNSTIYFSDSAFEDIANLIKEEIFRCHAINLNVASGTSAGNGDILIKNNPNLNGEKYRLTVNGSITLESSGINGIFPGSVSIVQAIRPSGAGTGAVLNMTINDEPHKEFRSVMIDVKNFWYSPNDIKRFIKLARFYKVRYLSLHTGEKQWIGAVLNQTANYSVAQRRAHNLYTKAEMDDIIQFGRQNGVYLFPHNECTPSFGHMKDAMKEDFNPNDGFAGYADELDGQGSFANFNGEENNQRFRNVIAEAHRRAINQFKAGYPNGMKMPMYHVGPVQSEGGMSDNLANYFRSILVAEDPDIKMSYWAGPNTTNSALNNFKNQLTPICYTKQFHPSFANHLQNNWKIVNAAWSPLYIVGGSIARPVETVFNEWNYFRGGTDGISGGPIQYDNFEGINNSNLIGGLLCTWENDKNINFVYLKDRLPAFSEHAWHHKTWPYPATDFSAFQSSMSVTADVAELFVSNSLPPLAPNRVSATDGLFPDKVRITWNAADNGPTEYKLFRGTSNNPNNATQIVSLSGNEIVYEDTNVTIGTTYRYWVKAKNNFGDSNFSDFNSGSAGNGGGLVTGYEPFDYSAGQNISGKNGGTGWRNSWQIESSNGQATINNYGLTYSNLLTSGNSLRIKPTTDTPSLNIIRNTSGQIGAEGVSTWVSFIIRARKVANGHLAFFMNDAFDLGLVKRWGTKLLNTTMLDNETYFVVYQFECGPGNDTARYWLNPDLNVIPSPSNVSVLRFDRDLGTQNRIKINLQGYGQGDYDIDEIRIGTSFSEVMPTDTLSTDDVVVSNDDIVISPNPFSSEIKIDLSKNKNYEEVVLYDITGRVIKQSKTNNQNSITLSNLSNLSNGVYILKLLGNNNTKSTILIRK